MLKGDLSDPPGVEMYRKLKTLKKTGFVVYLCLRSSSQLEGYHLSLRETRKASGATAGPRWQVPVTNEHDFRWTVRALVARGVLPRWLAHHDVALMDELFDAAEQLGLDTGALLPCWVRTPRRVGRVLQHGMHYALEHHRSSFVHPSRVSAAAAPRATWSQSSAAAAAAAPGSSTSTLEWWARGVGIAGVATSRTEDVVRLLVASPELLHDPAELSRVARRHGHPMMPPAAAKFAERVLLDEAAYALLQSRRYKEFLRGLHTPAPRPHGGADVLEEAEAAATAIEEVGVPSQPPSLGAVGAGRSLVVNPAVMPAPRTPRRSSPRRRSAAAAARLLSPVDATPEGGETKKERERRMARKRKRKQRKDNKALRESEILYKQQQRDAKPW